MTLKKFLLIFFGIEMAGISFAIPVVVSHIESPKARELRMQSGSMMKRTIVTSPRHTNRVSKVDFQWSFPAADMSNVDHFSIYIGTAPGDYTTWQDVGTNFNYTLLRTNWAESVMRHYAVVVAAAKPGQLDSLPSNEIHWPDYPPDHVALTWSRSWPTVTILSSSDARLPLSQWTTVATITGTNYYAEPIAFDLGKKFFALNRPDTLFINLFNPTP